MDTSDHLNSKNSLLQYLPMYTFAPVCGNDECGNDKVMNI